MKVLYQNNQKFDFEVHSKKSINWNTKTINWKSLI